MEIMQNTVLHFPSPMLEYHLMTQYVESHLKRIFLSMEPSDVIRGLFTLVAHFGQEHPVNPERDNDKRDYRCMYRLGKLDLDPEKIIKFMETFENQEKKNKQ